MATNRAACTSVSYDQYTLDQARRLVADYVDDFRNVRLNAATFYTTPKEMLSEGALNEGRDVQWAK